MYVQNKHYVDTFIHREIEGSLRVRAPTDAFEKELRTKLKTYLEIYQTLGLPSDDIITNCVLAIREADTAGLIEDMVRSPNFDVLNEIGMKYDEDNKILSRVNGQKVQIWPSKRNDLITTKFDNLFYDRLASEINFCYKCACFASVSVLARKMAENLVIEIIRSRYKNSRNKGINLFWNRKKGRFHDFSYLIDKLEGLNKKSTFGPEKDIIKRLITLVKPFRTDSSSTAHSLVSNPTEDQVDRMKIPEIIALLHQVKMNI